MRSRTGSLPRSRWRAIERVVAGRAAVGDRGLALAEIDHEGGHRSTFARASALDGSSRLRRTAMAG